MDTYEYKLFTSAGMPTPSNPPVNDFEVSEDAVERALNDYASQGWEVVSFRFHERSQVAAQRRLIAFEALLRRRKP